MATSVALLTQLVGGTLQGDGDLAISGAQSVAKARAHEITFIVDEANLKKLADSNAGAVVVSPEFLDTLPSQAPCSRAVIVADDPQGAFIRILEHFRPARPRRRVGISPQAFVNPTASIGTGTNIYPGAYVGEGAIIGARCDIHPGVTIGDGCAIGDDVTLYPGVVLYADVIVGSRVIIHASAVIGADGFGYRLVDGKHQKIPQLGTVRIEDDVEIGACTTIDRATIGETVIGAGTKLDNLVMIAHNCELGQHNVFVSQVGLAGSVTTGDYVVCAGQVGIADHVHLGARCVLGSKAGVHKDIPAGQTYIGIPAEPMAQAIKIVMAQKKLPEMRETLRGLESRVAALCRHAGLDETDDPARRKSAA